MKTVVKYGSIDALRVTQHPHGTFHTIPGSNLGSRKQKFQPSNSGLGNKYIDFPLSECQKKNQLGVYLNMITH